MHMIKGEALRTTQVAHRKIVVNSRTISHNYKDQKKEGVVREGQLSIRGTSFHTI